MTKTVFSEHEDAKNNCLAEGIKDMAYEVIAHTAQSSPFIVSELKAFNKKDKEIVKDALRFKLNKKAGRL